MRASAVLLIILLIAVPFAEAEQQLPVPVMESNLLLYHAFVSEKGHGNPFIIDNFESSRSNRVVVDMVLLQQAIKLGGMDIHLSFYGQPNPARAQAEVKEGKAVVLAFETWACDFDDSVYMSDTIINDGEFLKVVVGRPDNKKLFKKVTSIDGWKELTAITGHTWSIDQNTLKEMEVKHIYLAYRYDLQLLMLHEGRADLGLYEHATISKNMPEGLTIVPGITVGLRGTRHFMVSKLHPMGQSLFEAIQKGIKILKNRGAFRKAYAECGFFAKEIESWNRIYP